MTAYQRAVVPTVGDWAGRYASLREVTGEDVAAALEPLTGSARTVTAVALRSLFAALNRHTPRGFPPPVTASPATTAGMYLRTIQRHNKDGSVVRYVQLAHNVRDPRSGNSIAHTIHSFGREDQLDRAALARLAESIQRYLRDTGG